MTTTNTQKNIKTHENDPGMSYSAIGFLQTCLMASTAHLFRFGIPINGIEFKLKGFEVLPTAIMGMYATKKIADSLNLDDDVDYMAEVMNGGFVGVITPQLFHAVHAPLSFAFQAFAAYSLLYEENIEHPNLPRERTKYFIENINHLLQYSSGHLEGEINQVNMEVEMMANVSKISPMLAIYDLPLLLFAGALVSDCPLISNAKQLFEKLGNVVEQLNPTATFLVAYQEVEVAGETNENTDL